MRGGGCARWTSVHGLGATLFAGSARGTDDDVQLAWPGPAGKWLRRNTELLGEPQGNALAPRWEEHCRLGVREVVGAADLLDAVAECADPACDLTGVVD